MEEVKKNKGGRKGLGWEKVQKETIGKMWEYAAQIFDTPSGQYEKEKMELAKRLLPRTVPQMQQISGADGGDLVVKLVSYGGDYNPTPVQPEVVPTGGTESEDAV